MSNKTTYELLLDIMNPDIESDIADVRRIIMLAEDTGFTIKQSIVVSPMLLNFALEHRHSTDPDDEIAVYSAIRTGASMIFPNQDSLQCLFPLLEMNHKIDTSLVTAKMIGRIFEAQPPSDINQYEFVAEKLLEIINPRLIDHIVALSSRESAKMQLCITALAAMGSEKIYRVLEKIEKKERWFRTYVLHNLQELEAMRNKRQVPVTLQMRKFAKEVIKIADDMVRNRI